MDYPVPNFGDIDHDISASQSHEADASKELKHKWTPVKDEKTEKYIVPSPNVEFHLNDDDSLRTSFATLV